VPVPETTVRSVVVGSAFWLAILLVLTFSDYLTRSWLSFG